MGSLTSVFDHLSLPKDGYYYNEGAVANILSLDQITKEFWVYMNIIVNDAFYIINNKGKYLQFGCLKHNLYGVYLRDRKPEEVCYAFSTVDGNNALFSELDCKQAKAVRNLQERTGYPSNIDLANAIEYNFLGTCEINRRDICIANKMFGPNKGALCRKWTKRPNKMDRPSVEITTNISEEVLLEYRDVHLDVDMIYVNGIGFLTIVSRNLRLVHCQCLWQQGALW